MILRRCIKQFLDFPFPEALQYDRKHSFTALQSGIKIITEPYNTPLCTLGIMIDVGSKNDGSSSGLSLLSSHMLLSGSKHNSSKEIMKKLESLSNYSVNVTRDTTWLEFQTLKENIPGLFKLLGEMFTENSYQPEFLHSLKTGITKENEVLLQNPQYLLYENIHRTAFNNHSIGGFVRGDSNTIPKITRSEVVEFINSKYTSNNLIISSSGGVDHNQIVELTEKHFWRLPVSNPSKLSTPDFFSSSILQESDEPFTYIAIAYPSGSYSHPSLHNFQILQNILTLSSIPSTDKNYFQSLLDTPGLISHNCHLATYSECGIIIHLLECLPEAAVFVGSAVIRTMNRLGKTIHPEELERAKNMYYYKLILESSMKSCQNNANHARFFGKKINRSELASKVIGLTSESLVQSIAEWVNTIYPVIGVYGSITIEDLIEKIYQNSE